jgi:CubicO group peptidase (beta-lactamase class C family)
MLAHTSFSLGFNKPNTRFPFGTTIAAYGTPGAGGSFAYADPATGTSFAYAMNRPGFYLVNDPREDALSKAVFSCI